MPSTLFYFFFSRSHTSLNYLRDHGKELKSKKKNTLNRRWTLAKSERKRKRAKVRARARDVDRKETGQRERVRVRGETKSKEQKFITNEHGRNALGRLNATTAIKSFGNSCESARFSAATLLSTQQQNRFSRMRWVNLMRWARRTCVRYYNNDCVRLFGTDSKLRRTTFFFFFLVLITSEAAKSEMRINK